MKTKVMDIVNAACSFESVSCRGFELEKLARDFLDLAGVPKNADIREIPVNWDSQFGVLFTVPEDKNYYSLFGGLSCADGSFFFELAITGTWRTISGGVSFDFLSEVGKNDIVLSLNYFSSRNASTDAKKAARMDALHKLAKNLLFIANNERLSIERKADQGYGFSQGLITVYDDLFDDLATMHGDWHMALYPCYGITLADWQAKYKNYLN